MATKKKMKKIDLSKDELLINLKSDYFKLINHEEIGKTPKLTSKLDNLEQNIRNRIKELNES